MSSSTPAGKPAECALLRAFYNDTQGVQWTNSNGWNNPVDTQTTCCGWKGIRCDGEGNVVAVQLRGNNVGGLMPNHLAKLPKLATVDLYFNAIAGTIPSEFSTVSSLRYLDLSNNYFDGEIPSGIFVLPSVTHVDLYANFLTGSVPTTYATQYACDVYTSVSN
ncbi:hypothetical protein H9P43_010101 [Blastocladiella emersonii ATCC 22665]|nr:hypothetical protein H9P43_010101 [Blastocladiella emersonii ATCC 22665]